MYFAGWNSWHSAKHSISASERHPVICQCEWFHRFAASDKYKTSWRCWTNAVLVSHFVNIHLSILNQSHYPWRNMSTSVHKSPKTHKTHSETPASPPVNTDCRCKYLHVVLTRQTPRTSQAHLGDSQCHEAMPTRAPNQLKQNKQIKTITNNFSSLQGKVTPAEWSCSCVDISCMVFLVAV